MFEVLFNFVRLFTCVISISEFHVLVFHIMCWFILITMYMFFTKYLFRYLFLASWKNINTHAHSFLIFINQVPCIVQLYFLPEKFDDFLLVHFIFYTCNTDIMLTLSVKDKKKRNCMIYSTWKTSIWTITI